MIATFSSGPILYLLLEPAGASPGALESRGVPPHSRIDWPRRLSDQPTLTPRTSAVQGAARRASCSATCKAGFERATSLRFEKPLRERRFRVIGATGFEPATARPPAECATRLRHAPKRA